MFRVGQGVLQGEEDVGIEEVRRISQQRVSIPGQNPGIKQRVSDVAGHSRGQVAPEGMGANQSQKAIESADESR